MASDSDSEEYTFDGRRTGWTVDDAVEQIEEFGDDPENHFYYTTYSDVYHTTPRCPHIQNSNRIHHAAMLSSLNGPLSGGAHRVFGPTEEHCHGVSKCDWCRQHGDRDA